jgi:pimeloyl-ACP methyl ester carboxylesterase
MNSRIIAVVVTFLLLAVVGVRLAGAAEWEHALTPRPQGLKTAAFKLYVPESAKIVRTILLVHGHQGGSNLYGATPDTDVKGFNVGWRDLADEESCALLLTNVFYTDTPSPEPELYRRQTPIGVGAIEAAIEALAEKSGHPELRHAPWVTAGLSWGGRQAFEYAKARPAKCLGFIPIHGWLDHPNDTDYAKGLALEDAEGAFTVPGLFSIADGDGVLAPMTPIVLKARARGARWAAAIEARTPHHRLGNQPFPKFWIRRLLALRLPDDYEAQVMKGPVKLKELSEESGWLGVMNVEEKPAGQSRLSPPSTLKQLRVTAAEIHSFAAFPAERGAAHWLPDAETARAWHKFVSEGTIRRDEDLPK